MDQSIPFLRKKKPVVAVKRFLLNVTSGKIQIYTPPYLNENLLVLILTKVS